MREVALGEVLAQVKDEVPLVADDSYLTVGILSYGLGLFSRPVVRGDETSYKSYFRLRRDQFVYSKLFAWEGALAVVDQAFDGRFVSPEFPTFEVDHDFAEPAFVRLLCRWPALWARVHAGQSGMGGRRKRVQPAQLLKVAIPLPPLDQQRRYVDLLASLDEGLSAMEALVSRATVAVNACRRLIIDLSDWPRVPLSELVTIVAKLVDPTDPEYSALPHIGVDRIESATGRLLDLQSAAEDGVISGKYLFGPEDVVYSKIRPNLRKVVWPQIRGLSSADAYPLRPGSQIDAGYLQHLLLSDRFSDEATAKSGRTKMPKINREELLSILVPCPSLEAQREAGLTLASIAAVGSAAQAELVVARALRAAVLHDLLSGEREIPDVYDTLLEAS